MGHPSDFVCSDVRSIDITDQYGIIQTSSFANCWSSIEAVRNFSRTQSIGERARGYLFGQNEQGDEIRIHLKRCMTPLHETRELIMQIASLCISILQIESHIRIACFDSYRGAQLSGAQYEAPVMTNWARISCVQGNSPKSLLCHERVG